jgi:hypothetical protein
MKITTLEDLIAELHHLDGTDFKVKLSLDTRTFIKLKHDLQKDFETFKVPERNFADVAKDFADIKIHTSFGELVIERQMGDKEQVEHERYLQKHQDRLIREGKVSAPND